MIDGTGGGGSVKMLEQIGATYIPAVPGWSDVVKNLETNYRKVNDVSGATIMGDGRVALILDVGSLVRRSRH